MFANGLCPSLSSRHSSPPLCKRDLGRHRSCCLRFTGLAAIGRGLRPAQRKSHCTICADTIPFLTAGLCPAQFPAAAANSTSTQGRALVKRCVAEPPLFPAKVSRSQARKPFRRERAREANHHCFCHSQIFETCWRSDSKRAATERHTRHKSAPTAAKAQRS